MRAKKNSKGKKLGGWRGAGKKKKISKVSKASKASKKQANTDTAKIVIRKPDKVGAKDSKYWYEDDGINYGGQYNYNNWQSYNVIPHHDTPLRFSPYAWLKLMFFCHKGGTEVGGFGVTDKEDRYLITDFITVDQKTTAASVDFDDTAVADYFDDMVDAGYQPKDFARVWLHTHPGGSPSPSPIDETTFKGVFGMCDWAVMFIMANAGECYARLQFTNEKGKQEEEKMAIEIDYRAEHKELDVDAWEKEFEANIHPFISTYVIKKTKTKDSVNNSGISLKEEDPAADYDNADWELGAYASNRDKYTYYDGYGCYQGDEENSAPGETSGFTDGDVGPPPVSWCMGKFIENMEEISYNVYCSDTFWNYAIQPEGRGYSPTEYTDQAYYILEIMHAEIQKKMDAIRTEPTVLYINISEPQRSYDRSKPKELEVGIFVDVEEVSATLITRSEADSKIVELMLESPSTYPLVKQDKETQTEGAV